MKHYIVLAGVLLLMIAGISSCKEKACTCVNGGTCQSDQCQCPAGYGGENCEVLLRDKVIAQYNAGLSSSGGAGNCFNSVYIITIEASNLGPEYVIVRNYDGRGTDVFGKISESSTVYGIFIPQQLANSNSFLGDVTLDKPGITGTYKWNGTGGCSGTLTRRL